MSRKIAGEIKNRVYSGEFQRGGRLPSEVELAASLGVSRATLREALRLVEEEGIIFSRRGAGSFVRPESQLIVEGLEKIGSWTKSIRKAGFLAENRVLSVKPFELIGHTAEVLKTPEGAPAYMIESLRLADRQPVIYSCLILKATSVLNPDTVQKCSQYESMLEFLWDTAGIRIEYAVEKLKLVFAGPPITHLLSIAVETPILLLEGPAYDSHDDPLYLESTYFRCDTYDFMLVRRQ